MRCICAMLAAGILVAGCSKKEGPPKEGPPPGPGPVQGKGQADEDNRAQEDPAVADYFKKKGWSLFRDMRIPDGKWVTVLSMGKDLFEKVKLTPEDFKMIAKSKSLQMLDLSKVTNTSDEGLKEIAGIPQMQNIAISGEEVTDAGIKAMAQSKSLETINLNSTKKVTDAGIKELAKLPKLQALFLSFMNLNGSAFEAFAGSKSLQSVGLEYVDGLTDDGIKNLGRLPNLNELRIKGGFGESKLTAAGIKGIVDSRLPARFEFDTKLIDDGLFTALVAKGWLYGPSPPGTEDSKDKIKKPATPAEVREIVLDDSKVTDKGLAAILNCTNVRSLHLQRTGITDETLKKMSGFKNLEYLALEKTKVTAAGLEAVSACPIRHVAMQWCDLSEDHFKAFGKMTGLEELWLGDAKMKADWLKHIAKLPKLKELNLLGADFNDDAVKYVTGLPSLENLTLNNTKLGDKGFQELVALPKLESLLVDGTGVTKEVYQKAKKDHPKMRLYYYRYDR